MPRRLHCLMLMLVLALPSSMLVAGCVYTRTDPETGERERISGREARQYLRDDQPTFRTRDPAISADQAQ